MNPPDSPYRHTRAGGYPYFQSHLKATKLLDSRLRGNDEFYRTLEQR